MCGGDQDPTVFFQNAQIMAALWTPYVQGGLVSVLDLNGAPQAGNPFAPLQVALQQQEAQLIAANGHDRRSRPSTPPRRRSAWWRRAASLRKFRKLGEGRSCRRKS